MNTYERAYNSWGQNEQLATLMEECGELIQCCNKLRRKPTKETWEHFAEEIADVQIMIRQFTETQSGLNDLIVSKQFEKIKRLEQTLNRIKELEVTK